MVRRRQTTQTTDTSASQRQSQSQSQSRTDRSTVTPDEDTMTGLSTWSGRSQWIFFAVASGACAAFNGVFAKLYVSLFWGHDAFL
jgi:hypothetical protein